MPIPNIVVKHDSYGCPWFGVNVGEVQHMNYRDFEIAFRELKEVSEDLKSIVNSTGEVK